MSLIKFNLKESKIVWKALTEKKRGFEILDEKQFYEQNCDKESKEIQKILNKIEKKFINA
jgi:hypothetical protein